MEIGSAADVKELNQQGVERHLRQEAKLQEDAAARKEQAQATPAVEGLGGLVDTKA